MTKLITNLFPRSGKVLALVLLATSVAFAGTVTITVIPSIGPTVPSASLGLYLADAEHALEFGLSSFGTPGDPTQYTVATGPISGADFIRTTFNSWRGNASPTGAFAGEFGNELYFGISIFSTTAFAMSDVSFLFHTDLFDIPGDLTGLTFNGHTVGVNTATGFRYDGVSHTGDDTTLINRLWYSGLGIFAGPETDPGSLLADINSLNLGTVSGTYTLTDYTTGLPLGSGGAALDVVPEPGTIALLSLGFGAMLCFRKKAFGTRTK